MVRDAEDCQGSPPPHATPTQRVVSMAPARPAENAAPHAGEEAQGPLRVLRHHGELPRACQGALRDKAHLAKGARAPIPATPAMGEDAADAGAVSAPVSAHRTPARNLAKLSSEEPDAWKTAR